MKMLLNKKQYLDKVHGCWIGKNIGGTLGAPFEGTKEMPIITDFTTPKGEPLPNDDLDLQLVWLNALRDHGPLSVDGNVLADYWLTHVTPHWGEYGISKGNLLSGLLPPLSGEYDNDWKKSNGAWIRSEIWSCLTPGIPNLAVKYAISDASVDHGYSEGTYAEIFTAALESLAFFENDLRTLINKALSYVPKESYLARSVNAVLEAYDNGVAWKKARETVVELNVHDLGWFMAPANVAFVVIGLIYGEGDFKKSMTYAIGCGDDTDCTGATCGAILGIIKGASGLPQDWVEHIGDRIATCCINASYTYTPNIPKTCAELTERVSEMMINVMSAYGISVEYTDGDTEFSSDEADAVYRGYAQRILARNPLSYEINTSTHTGALVEYSTAPEVKADTPFEISLTLWNKWRDSHRLEISLVLPEGWTADCPRSVFLHNQGLNRDLKNIKITVTPNENINAVNRLYAIIRSEINATALTVPFALFG